MQIIENAKFKVLQSPDFNYVFNKDTGYYAQWGATPSEDPARCPYGPVIADIEVVSMCKGPGGKLCPFCYKSNTPSGEYMSLSTYKTLFDKLPSTLTQIAFGADADCSLNPDLFDIMRYTRSKGVIPNITVADISRETAHRLAAVCGAVAVSWYGVYSSKDYCYNSIQYLSEAGLQQINMHFMLSKETLPYVDVLIHDIKHDSRLTNLNAVVFLSLKQKGRGKSFQGCTQAEFQSVVDRMFAADINFGFDSCSQPKFLASVTSHPAYAELQQMSESCESFAQSIYINELGQVTPCSFMEHALWDNGKRYAWNLLDPLVKFSDIWNSTKAQNFASQASTCASCGKGCQYYNV